MADNSRSVSGAVELKDNSRERVAFDLMLRISHAEDGLKKDRDYFLMLYRQCWKAANGQTLESIRRQD